MFVYVNTVGNRVTSRILLNTEKIIYVEPHASGNGSTLYLDNSKVIVIKESQEEFEGLIFAATGLLATFANAAPPEPEKPKTNRGDKSPDFTDRMKAARDAKRAAKAAQNMAVGVGALG